MKTTFDLGKGAVVLGLVLFYSWTAANGLPFREAPRDGYYDSLAAAFLAGQLHLLEAPNPQLFELGQPYEPGRNAWLRLHDASLYHGRYYLYFGVVPALALFVPWRLVGLGDLPESAAALVFATVGLLFWTAVLRRLVREHLPGTPAWIEASAGLVLGITSVVPFVLRCPFIYEVAIAGGYCFLAGATFFFLSAGDGDRVRPARVALGSLCLGLAAGCRPNLMVAAPLLPLLALPAWSRSAGGRRQVLAALAIPLGLCLLLLGLYNHARFDSWTEFGARYQLQGQRPVFWFDPRAVPVAVYYHFLAPPDLRLDFPFVFVANRYPGTLPEGFFTGPSTGLLVHAPFVLALLAAPLLLRGAPVENGDKLRLRLYVLTAVGVLLPLLTAFVFGSAAMRFEVDFASFLVLPALVLLIVADRRAPPRPRWRLAALLLLAWSVAAGLALSVQGGSDGLRLWNAPAFARLERRFEPLRIALGRLLVREARGVFRMRIAFPERAAADDEPVLSSGTKDESDVLVAKQAGPGQFVLELRPTSGPPQATRALAFEPGRFYDLEVELDHVGRLVRGRIDGREAFAFSARIGPVHPNRIAYGRGPRGHGASSIGRFSGTIVPEAMLWAGRPGLEALPPISASPAVFTETGDEPAGADGQLWIPAGKDGAYERAGGQWRWIPRVFVDRVRVDRELTFVARSAGLVEGVLWSGDDERPDRVDVRHLGGGKLAFEFVRGRGAVEAGAAGAPFAVPPGHASSVAVILDRAAGDVVVRLDGRDVLHARADLLPIDRSLLRLGPSSP